MNKTNISLLNVPENFFPIYNLISQEQHISLVK